MILRIVVAIVLVLTAACGGVAPEEPLEVAFIANAGFMVSTPQHRILIDAVFGFTEGAEIDWAPRPQVLAEIEAAAPPYDRIDAVLVTHEHMDHFDSISAARLLASSPETVLVCPSGLAAGLQVEAPEVADQILGLSAEWGNVARTEVNGVAITALAVRHGGESWFDLEHLAYLVELDGNKILHLGDALESAEEYEAFSWLADEEIDVALVPHWLIREEAMVGVLNRVVQPEQVILMHIEPHEMGSTTQRVAALESQLPQIHIFDQKMSTLQIGE